MRDGRHEAGCFFGGPVGEAYWFIVDTCPLNHHDGDIPPLVSSAANADAAYEHIRLAGMLRTGESG